MTISKIFEGYLLINWKTGYMKVKKKKGKNDFHWIPIKFTIKINTPEIKDVQAKGEITIPEAQAEMIIEEDI